MASNFSSSASEFSDEPSDYEAELFSDPLADPYAFSESTPIRKNSTVEVARKRIIETASPSTPATSSALTSSDSTSAPKKKSGYPTSLAGRKTAAELSQSSASPARSDPTLESSTASELTLQAASLAGSTFENKVEKSLLEITSTLSRVVKRLDKQECFLQTLEKKTALSISPSTSDTAKRPKVPLLVRAEVRRMYKTLCEEDEDFLGFNTDNGVTFKDSANKVVQDRLIKEVKGANPSFQSGLIRSATYTYFWTLCQKSSLKRRGKLQERNRIRRRRERVNRKLQDRIAVLKKSSMPEKNKSRWSSILTLEFMSSEESDIDSGDTLIKHGLPWRSEKVNQFLKNLDTHVDETKSQQSKRQAKPRAIAGNVSGRNRPKGEYPRWAFSS